MADYESCKSYRKAYRRFLSFYARISRTLNSILAQNDLIIAKLKDIEDLLSKKFADTSTKESIKEESKGS